MSQEGFTKYGPALRPGGALLIEEDLVRLPDDYPAARVFGIPATELAVEAGRKMVANIVMLGFLVAVTGVVGRAAMEEAIRSSVPKGTEELNLGAFSRGFVHGELLLSERGAPIPTRPASGDRQRARSRSTPMRAPEPARPPRADRGGRPRRRAPRARAGRRRPAGDALHAGRAEPGGRRRARLVALRRGPAADRAAQPPGDRGARGRRGRGARAARRRPARRGCACGRSRSTRRAAPPAASACRSVPSSSRRRRGSRPAAP